MDDLPDPDPVDMYRTWNEGDIAHQLDNKPITENPYSPEDEPLKWRLWNRGWEGKSLRAGVTPPPALIPQRIPRSTYLGGTLIRRSWWNRLFRRAAI
jgi:hypothetical protein